MGGLGIMMTSIAPIEILVSQQSARRHHLSNYYMSVILAQRLAKHQHVWSHETSLWDKV
jgi:hypothetical protein